IVDGTSERQASRPRTSARRATVVVPGVVGSPPPRAVAKAATGDVDGEGLGIVLPGVLLASALAMAAVVIRRRRSSKAQ
ncbi:MAG: hypothetical protein ACR2NB_01565, partial [Solirubrobacteraceae bacterium]